MKNKIVLAYSGGLDTSVILKWLQTEYNADVIAYVCIAIHVAKAVDVDPGVDILEGGVAGEEGGLAMHGGASPFQNVHTMEVCVYLHVQQVNGM